MHRADRDSDEGTARAAHSEQAGAALPQYVHVHLVPGDAEAVDGRADGLVNRGAGLL